MKREITGKILLCIALAVTIAALDLIAVRWIVQRQISPVTVPVACVDLYGGHIISANDIDLITVPEAYVMEHTLGNIKQVTGRKVADHVVIPAGSLFYETQLEKQKKDHSSE